ncbi:DUF5662 family protein [Fibrobacter sp.]|uniref:DUF5662 family protein n=1 Tax=Fibrobacter sp. TaxID=35828 RepID=UPI00386B8C21
MTRGKLVYIDEEGNVFVSNEFNGDMYYEKGSIGQTYAKAFEKMPHHLGIAAMSSWLYKLQSPIHKYDADEVRFIHVGDNKIDLTRDTYFKFWFSDYLYIRNDAKTFTITNRAGEQAVLPENSISIYCFGVYEDCINISNQPTTEDDVIDSTAATEEHRQQVARNIQHFCNKITFRAAAHDLSKLQQPEKAGFDRATLKLKDMTYGSPEYAKSLEELSETLEHHYAHNDHHPQFYKNGVAGMNLYALVEMYEDWKAAGKRNKDGNIVKSVELNKDKFCLDEQLYSILMNTAKMDLEEENSHK